MSASYSKLRLVHLTMLLSLFMVSTANAAQQHVPRKKPAKQAQPAPEPPPAQPTPPPTLQQLPALPPKVRYSNGLLTIVAENSTLGDILRAVRTQTGAAVEIPPNATERVVTHLGPGPARDVLVSLLHGSRFNYVMLGSPTHPGMVDRIILTSKSGGAADTGSAAIPPGQSPGAANPIEEPETPSGVDMAEQPADGGADLSPDQETEQPQPNGQQQVKTPEQLLRELQLQQQQQQQQQQGASGEGQPGPNPPPQ
jgi:hypothetical protein